MLLLKCVSIYRPVHRIDRALIKATVAETPTSAAPNVPYQSSIFKNVVDFVYKLSCDVGPENMRPKPFVLVEFSAAINQLDSKTDVQLHLRSKYDMLIMTAKTNGALVWLPPLHVHHAAVAILEPNLLFLYK
jgi:hypothetical protein